MPGESALLGAAGLGRSGQSQHLPGLRLGHPPGNLPPTAAGRACSFSRSASGLLPKGLVLFVRGSSLLMQRLGGQADGLVLPPRTPSSWCASAPPPPLGSVPPPHLLPPGSATSAGPASVVSPGAPRAVGVLPRGSRQPLRQSTLPKQLLRPLLQVSGLLPLYVGLPEQCSSRLPPPLTP